MQPATKPIAQAPIKQRPVLAIAIICLMIGGGIGFFAGVLSVKVARDFLSGMFQNERAADVTQGVVIARPAFVFTRPGNWQIDTKDTDYDPDHMFSVDSPGQSFVMFFVADGDLDPATAVDEHVKMQTSKVMKDATQTPLTTWGSHSGSGILLTGKQLGMMSGTIRIFAFREHDKTYTLIESTYDEDRASVQPGFDLIAQTFRVK
jgi:hypothetical protein